jgi:hypothetical protein
MIKIQWKEALEKMNVDPIAFKNEFIEIFLEDQIIFDKILNLAVFQNVFHSVGNECSGCSECYSGDTEFEMTHDCLKLNDIWNKTMTKMSSYVASEAEESSTEYSDENEIHVINSLVADLDQRYGDLKTTSTSSNSVD